MIPICNSMNLAYACDGLRKLLRFDKNISISIYNRFTELLEQIELPQTPKDINVPYINIPVIGHSMFNGYQDLTIPTTKVPAYAMFRLLRYLTASNTTDPLPYFYKKCAQVLNHLSLFELDKKLLIEGLTIYGSISEGLLFDKDIKECILNMGQLAMKYCEEFTIKEVSKIAEAILGIRAFKYTSWFKLLELKAFESIDSIDDYELVLDIAEKFIRYHIAVNHGRDIKIEPLIYFQELFPIDNPLLYKIYIITKTKKMSNETRYKLGILLGFAGYSVTIPVNMSAYSIISASVQNVLHPGLANVEFNDLVRIVNELTDYNDVALLIFVFAKHNTQLDWNYFKKFYNNNKQFIKSQPHKIAFLWALKEKVHVDYEISLLTVSEQKMLNEINQFE